jgi:hypothetical protein
VIQIAANIIRLSESLILAFLFSTLTMSVVGCGDPRASEVAAMNDSNIKRVVNLYGAFQVTHAWHGPKDEGELRDFVAGHGLPDKNFEMMGIDPKNLEAAFVSERDRKPFKVRYGVTGGPGAVAALVFEEDGVNGKRNVAFNGPFVEEVNANRYNDLWEGRGGMPSGMKQISRPEAGSPNASSPP